MKKGEIWTNYIDGRFKKITEQENQDLGGGNPKNKREEEYEDESDKFDIDIQKIYEIYFNFLYKNIFFS